MIVACHLWKERNARLFDSCSAPIAVILDRIKMQIDLWVAAGAKELGVYFVSSTHEDRTLASVLVKTFITIYAHFIFKFQNF
jgi:hypothetical protein